MFLKSTKRLQKWIHKTSERTLVKIKVNRPKRANLQRQNFRTRKLTNFTKSQLKWDIATWTLKIALERKHQKINWIPVPEKALIS